MKKLQLICILCFTFHVGICQETALRILGTSHYSEKAYSKVLLLNFEYDPEICNPITLNKSIDIQVNELIENLKSEQIENQLIQKENFNKNPEKNKLYEMVISLDADDYKIFKLLNTSGIKLIKTYYKYPEDNFLLEDERAILALKNSENKAIEISKSLGYEILEIISIDDETSDATEDDDNIDDTISEETRVLLNSFYERLNASEINSYPTRESEYNIWVTFKIKKT